MLKILGSVIGDPKYTNEFLKFLEIAESEKFEVITLYHPISILRIVEEIISERYDLIALNIRHSMALTSSIIEELEDALSSEEIQKNRFVFFGETEIGKDLLYKEFFDKVFYVNNSEGQIRTYFREVYNSKSNHKHAANLIERIIQKKPFPLLRHNFGKPTLEETITGIRKLSLSKILDVVSIDPDQNARDFFVKQGSMTNSTDGGRGVPVRTFDDVAALYKSSRCGNYPLIGCYAGRSDMMHWAEMSDKIIHNAWGIVPLCSYSMLDGKSRKSVIEAIKENQFNMKWYADRKVPLEVNEAYQWSKLGAHDSLVVAMAYLAAYNAKKAGVQSYVSHFLTDAVPGSLPSMEISKMLAIIEVISELEDNLFKVYRQVTVSITRSSNNPSIIKGQLLSISRMNIVIKPHIVHVASFSNGGHSTETDEIIGNCKLVEEVIRNGYEGTPDDKSDILILGRKSELVIQAKLILDAICRIHEGGGDPLIDPVTIAKSIEIGILNLPHFKKHLNNAESITTKIIKGACYVIDIQTGIPISEKERLREILLKHKSDHLV
jgi:hypothetical protein